MAVKLSGKGNVIYLKAPVLTDDNVKNDNIFAYLRKVWLKLEPDSGSSISNTADRDEQLEEQVDAIMNSDDGEDFF